MNVYPLEPYPYWQQVLGEAEFPLGSFGEDAGPERALLGVQENGRTGDGISKSSGRITPKACGTSTPRIDSGFCKQRDAAMDR